MFVVFRSEVQKGKEVKCRKILICLCPRILGIRIPSGSISSVEIFLANRYLPFVKNEIFFSENMSHENL